MNSTVLERMIESYMATDQPTYSFGWQGGEPTLMGLDFFRAVTRLQQKYGKKGAVVANGLQTNTTLITEELAAHLSRYNFLIGVSLDGPESVHNRYRVNISGKGSHDKVIKGINRLRRHGVEYNVLTLVSASNVAQPREIYRYLVDTGAMFHQYISCVEFDENGDPLPYSITGRQWGDFLCALFEEWIEKDTRRVSIRLFDSILTYLVDGSPNVCDMDTNCCQYFVVEHNGDIYPCDFFVEPDLKLGNVMDTSWEECLKSEVFLEFGRRKSLWNSECRECPYLGFCAGDCPKQRFYRREDTRQLSVLCEGWKQFYDLSLSRFEGLAKMIKRERSSQMSPDVLPGRNQECYCGSGKKFKLCHGK